MIVFAIRDGSEYILRSFAMLHRTRPFILLCVLILDVLLLTTARLQENTAPLQEDTAVLRRPREWKAIDGQWTNDQGILTGRSSWEARYISSPGAPWQEYIFSGQLKFKENESTSEIDLLFHLRDIQPEQGMEQDKGHYYQVSLIPQIQSIVLSKVGNKVEPLQSLHFELKAGQWYRFRVEVNDTTIKVFIDENRVMSYFSLAYSSGGVGIRTFWGSTGYFKDLSIQLPGVNDTTALSPEANQSFNSKIAGQLPKSTLLMPNLLFSDVNFEQDLAASNREISKIYPLLPYQEQATLPEISELHMPPTPMTISINIASKETQKLHPSILSIDVSGIDFATPITTSECLKMRDAFIDTSSIIFSWLRLQRVDVEKIYILWSNDPSFQQRAEQWLQMTGTSRDSCRAKYDNEYVEYFHWNSPDIYVSNYFLSQKDPDNPEFATHDFVVRSRFHLKDGREQAYFIVDLLGDNIEIAKKGFISWLKLHDLTDQQIQGLDITYHSSNQ